MKKIFTLLLVLFAATSCEEYSESPEKASYQSSEGYKIVNPEGNDFLCKVYRFVYNNHSYIEFILDEVGYDPYSGVVHDPDCPCHGKAISPAAVPSSNSSSSDYESIFGSW